MAPSLITSLAASVIERASKTGITLALAESCTGGLVSAALTDIPGSSAVLDRSFVTYSNEAKMDMLAVRADLITAYGAVSDPVAGAMAAGALAHSRADISVSITGIAGPGGGTADKPVGLVWFGVADRCGTLRTERRVFANRGRAVVRHHAVTTALRLLLQAINAY